MSDDYVLQCTSIHKEFPSESGNGVLRILQGVDLPVSYTHLTLPTIYSV